MKSFHKLLKKKNIITNSFNTTPGHIKRCSLWIEIVPKKKEQTVQIKRKLKMKN